VTLIELKVKLKKVIKKLKVKFVLFHDFKLTFLLTKLKN